MSQQNTVTRVANCMHDYKQWQCEGASRQHGSLPVYICAQIQFNAFCNYYIFILCHRHHCLRWHIIIITFISRLLRVL